MVKRITVIRHSQSLHNQNIYPEGDPRLLNSRLSEYGRDQAKNFSASFDVLILSPLRRAVETYACSSIATRDLQICPLFREQRDGKNINQLENEAPGVVESTMDIRMRAIQARKFLESLHSDNIGIISHGVFIWYLLEACGQIPLPTANLQTISFNL